MSKLLSVRLLVVLLILTTGACGVIRNRSNDYLKASEGKVLVVPDWYQSDRIRSRYPIPEVDNKDTSGEEFVVPAPPDRTELILDEQFTIEEMDGRQWLSVTNVPARAWPMITKFLASRGFEVGYSNVRKGLIQSSVFQEGKLSSEYARQLDLLSEEQTGRTHHYHVLSFRLNQGVKRNSSEIRVRVIDVHDLNPDFNSWPEEDGYPGAENRVLEDLKLFFEANRDEKSFSLLAQDIGGASRVVLVSEDVEPYLKFDLDYARAWGVLVRSLRNAGIDVVDLDRSKGEIDIKYYDKVEGSLLGKLFGPGPDKLPANYRLKLNESNDSVRLDVIGAGSESPDRESRLKLLSLLLENVS